MNSTIEPLNVPCGNNGGVTLNVNRSDITIYNCGRLEGAANGAGNLTGPTISKNGSSVMSIHKWIFWVFALVSVVSAEKVLSDVSQEDAIVILSTIWEQVEPVTFGAAQAGLSRMASRPVLRARNSTSGTEVIAFDFKVEQQYDNSTVKRSESFDYVAGPGLASWKQLQVANDGYWWSGWEKVTGCLYTHLGESGSQTMEGCDEKSWSVSVSAGIDFKVFQAGASYTISESHSQCQSKTCDVSADSSLAIWAQKKMYWADTQVQECTYQALHPEYNGCGPWGPYIRLNAPISDGHDDNLNLGCSTGAASGCP